MEGEGTPVYALPNGIAPCNKPVVELVDIVKPEIRLLITHANQVGDLVASLCSNVSSHETFDVLYPVIMKHCRTVLFL